MSRREQIGLTLAALCLAVAGIVAGTSQPHFTWTGTPMRISYTFGFLALVCVVAAFATRGRLGVVLPFLPRIKIMAPERRPRLRRRYDVDHAQSLVDAGRMGERVAQVLPGVEVGPAEITPTQVGFPMRPRSRSQPSHLAKAAATTDADRREIANVQVLRGQGKRLHDELYDHADNAKHAELLGAIPKVYLGQAEDWYTRFRALAERYMSKKELYPVAPFPGWSKTLPAIAGGDAMKRLVNDLDAMFSTCLPVLQQIERRLSK